MACDVGYRSQAVKGYADFIMWLLGLLKPIMGETRRNQLKGYMAAYKSGLSGRSCYRKYPCYANNMSTKRGAAAKGSSRRADGGPDNSTVSTEAVDRSASSASVEELIVYDLVNATATANATANATDLAGE
ncbi:uncharacterized protein LOC117646179 [Thrips palmi]|uniref:Uncharacterized protein LOC117646179 n=1 Tax=Thrips palmi TaxID=161013 RepID=A0A6P8YS50_THRPL|nr:uncharacterized protein LOC117646179 [Thrips palmi]